MSDGHSWKVVKSSNLGIEPFYSLLVAVYCIVKLSETEPSGIEIGFSRTKPTSTENPSKDE